MRKFITKERIEKGWSGDRKYCVTDDAGTSYLLRICPEDRLDAVQRQHAWMQHLSLLGVPMCDSYECGLCDEGAYALQRWIDGTDAETVIPTLSPVQQYAYGIEAGAILQKIHSIPAPATLPDWAERFNAKIVRKLAAYEACPLRYENDSAILLFVQENRHLLQGRPQTYQHGDYHIGNMMLDSAGQLTIIDFNRDDFGDPWEEFNRIVWCAQAAPRFAAGMVDGYFHGQVPYKFWQLLALYIASNTLSSLPWAIPFGQAEIDTMQAQCRDVLDWYDQFRCVIPRWYTSA